MVGLYNPKGKRLPTQLLSLECLGGGLQWTACSAYGLRALSTSTQGQRPAWVPGDYLLPGFSPGTSSFGSAPWLRIATLRSLDKLEIQAAM